MWRTFVPEIEMKNLSMESEEDDKDIFAQVTKINIFTQP